MRYLRRAAVAALASAAAFASLPGLPAAADNHPEIVRFWLVDANTDTRLFELSDYQSLRLPVLPDELSIEAEGNGETESVVLELDGVQTSAENVAPYALGGDNGGDFFPVAALQNPGWIDVSARPYSADGAGGVQGDEASLSLYIDEPDFFVVSSSDRHDENPGDGKCTTAIGFTLKQVAPGSVDRFSIDGLSTVTEAAREQLASAAAAKTARSVNTPTAPVGDVLAIPGQGTSPPAPTGPGGLKGNPERDNLQGRACTLRAAIEEANAMPGSQRILVDGTKGPFELSKGQLVVTDGVSIMGHELPVIDAGRRSRTFLIDGNGDDIIVNLSSLDITRGEPPFSGERGGNIMITDEAFVQVYDSIIREGRANFGGGIYVQNDGSLRLNDSAVRDNTAGHPESFGGGGVTQRGGGIFNLEGSVHINDSSVFDNYAVRGGGVSNYGGTMRIENSSVLDNEAVALGGGIENNDNGGNDGVMHIAFATITGNVAGTAPSAPSDQRVGGGLYNHAGNTVFMASSILAENTDAWYEGSEHHAPDCYSPEQGDFKSYRYNVVGVLNDNCIFTDYSWGNTGGIDHGTEGSPLNPGLTNFRSFWGKLAYYNLTAASIALDEGGSAAAIYPCEDHDMRSRPRPVGEGCDIGAVERQ